ncbi:MAG: T9SS type A sorting domain-containing protein [Candidatus Cloacimonetes bacterium]|nr:T9SS type A sorting domain-containing protein [Candidatus Cloacimonadota bacterium]
MNSRNRLSRKWIGRLCLIALITGSIIVLSAQEFAGGSGTETDPWQIERAEHLNNVRNYLGEEHSDKYFMQTADIDLGIPPWNEGEGWVPIGWYFNWDDREAFYGQYDGNGHIIYGLFIDRADTHGQGLFGFINNAAISNLGLIDLEVTGRDFVGGLVGRTNESSISNCFSEGVVSSSRDHVGGLVGWNYWTTLSGCHSSGIVIGQGEDVGGLVGMNYHYSEISNCYSDAEVYGYGAGSHSGGLVGHNKYISVITGSYSLGDVYGLGAGARAGGLLGINTSTLINSYSRGNVSGAYFVGGLVGLNISQATIVNSYSTGSVSAYTNFGGLVGENSYATVVNSYWDMETSGQNTSAGGSGAMGRTTEEMTFPYAVHTFVEWDFENTWAADIDYSINAGYPYLRDFDDPVSVEDDLLALEKPIPLTNYPNPFNPETTIKYSLSENVDRLSIKIYNSRGQLVRTLVNAPHLQGEYEILWDGKNDNGTPVASGIYFYRLTTPDHEKVNKMLLLK